MVQRWFFPTIGWHSFGSFLVIIRFHLSSFVIIDKEWFKIGSSQKLVGIVRSADLLPYGSFLVIPPASTSVTSFSLSSRRKSGWLVLPNNWFWVVGGNQNSWFFPIIGWHSFVSADVINGRPSSDWSMIDWHWSLVHFCSSVYLYFWTHLCLL